MSSIIQIRNLAGEVLYTHEQAGATMRDAVEAAVAQGVSLRQANLPRVDLSGACLRGANLDGASLIGARLTGADLRDAHLQRIDMLGNQWWGETVHCWGEPVQWWGETVELRQTCFRDVDLRGADLSQAILRVISMRTGAPYSFDFRSAKLNHANLEGAYLCGATLRGMDLRDVRLRGVHLREADLRETDCSEVDFGAADLSMTIFNRAKLRGADLRELIEQDSTRFRCTDLSGARMSRDGWQSADFCGAILSGTGLHWVPDEDDDGSIDMDRTYRESPDPDPCNNYWNHTTGTLHAITRTPLRIDGLERPVIIFDGHIQIGCRACTPAEWTGFADPERPYYDLTIPNLWSAHKEWLVAAARAFAA